MSGVGLARWGVRPPTVVREPARDTQGIVICAECGHPVGTSKGSHRVHHPDVIDRELRQTTDELVTHGWACEMHPYEIVMPARVGSLGEGWTGVEVAFADEHVRQVPVPERELRELLGGVR